MNTGSTGIVVDIPPVKSAYTLQAAKLAIQDCIEPEESVLHVRL
ncbi:MAG TPA: hypothetical protein VK692_04925 [Chthoniobacterales bacterium]|nr:hypothetical protein [Chthoniobacterales bacterium]